MIIWVIGQRQNKGFRKQFEIVKALDLPLFLHERNCSEDFIQVFNDLDPEHKLRGCVHSFTGTVDTAKKLLDMGFYIGFNGSGMLFEVSHWIVSSLKQVEGQFVNTMQMALIVESLQLMLRINMLRLNSRANVWKSMIPSIW